MKTNNIKRIFIVLICAAGLYSSSTYIAEMSYLNTLLDGFNVMLFFISFFPFLIVSIALIREFFRSITRVLQY